MRVNLKHIKELNLTKNQQLIYIGDTYTYPVTFESLKDGYVTYNTFDWDDLHDFVYKVDIIDNFELEVTSLKSVDDLCADVNNKFSPIKNFMSMMNDLGWDIDSEDEIGKILKDELDNVNKSIDYLKVLRSKIE